MSYAICVLSSRATRRWVSPPFLLAIVQFLPSVFTQNTALEYMNLPGDAELSETLGKEPTQFTKLARFARP